MSTFSKIYFEEVIEIKVQLCMVLGTHNRSSLEDEKEELSISRILSQKKTNKQTKQNRKQKSTKKEMKPKHKTSLKPKLTTIPQEAQTPKYVQTNEGKDPGSKVKDVFMRYTVHKICQNQPELLEHEEESISSMLKARERKWSRFLGWWEMSRSGLSSLGWGVWLRWNLRQVKEDRICPENQEDLL